MISAAIKGNPGLWKEMERYMNENVEYDKDNIEDMVDRILEGEKAGEVLQPKKEKKLLTPEEARAHLSNWFEKTFGQKFDF